MGKPCSVVLLAMLAGHPVPFERGGKWGYKDAAGRVVIQPRFETGGEFSAEGLAAVVDEGGWAYIDTRGRLVVRPLIVDNGPDFFQEDLARFRRGGAVGFFAQNGQVVIEARFAFALPFSEGLAAVCEGCKEIREGEHSVVTGGSWGFIDRRGNLVIPFRFERAERFDRGRARVNSGGEWKSIDKKGRVVAEASIGSAWMEADGTIVLQLRAEGPGPAIGDALFRYPKTHPQYDSVLRHLGGLKAGEKKPVPPWPDK